MIDQLHPALAHHVVNSLGWRALRPLQGEAIEPLLAGHDAVLLAPTAGGKTEAAVFPLLTAMERERWTGVSVLYICPLKALLNNLAPRLATYAAWLGWSIAVWHGDVVASARQRILRERPDVLLTTPESIEAMLVSTKVEHRQFLGDLRAVVVDEVHALAGDDRGWHLLAVLERLTRLCGRPLQRIGTVDNAARVLAALHRGEKRLVFCDSRALVEKLGAALRERGVTTFLSEPVRELITVHRMDEKIMLVRGVSRRR